MESTEEKSIRSDDLQRQVYTELVYDSIFFGGRDGWSMVFTVKTSFLLQSRYEKFSIHFKVIIYDVSENK
jgi:hypothetical protein